MELDIQTAQDIYLQLLQAPHNKWRVKHQHVYCALRDGIAKECGLTAQVVQDTFEERAIKAKLAA